jgi:PleD family two-component response regulator
LIDNLKPGEGSPTILIVEDSPTQALSLRQTLEDAEYEVMSASNGMEALEHLSNNIPMLIISDIVMPEMNGFELCKKIKADKRLQKIPVILLSQLSSAEDII